VLGDPVNYHDIYGYDSIASSGIDYVCNNKASWLLLCDALGLRPDKRKHEERNDWNSCPLKKPGFFDTDEWRICYTTPDDKTRFSDGSECKYDEDGNLIGEGTYNYAPFPASIAHVCLDVLPYCIWGE
jgi:hypothetical protein